MQQLAAQGLRILESNPFTVDWMRRKVSVIGAGKVGSTIAHLLALKGMANVVLVNRTVGIAQGIALDIAEALPVEMSDVEVVGTGDYAAIAGSDIVVVTAGAQRKEGMSRDDLLKVNADIISSIAAEIKKHAPESKVIVITNPLDAMVYLVKKVTGFDRDRVIGMAGILDSSRFSSFIAEEVGVSVKDIHPLVLGSHGDTMVPLTRFTTISGKPVSDIVDKAKLDKIIERTRNGGAEIIKLEGSSAFYAPASSVVRMIDSILNDRKDVVPCSVYVDGEYGLEGVFIGLPVALGSKGVDRIVDLKLDESEMKMLSDSAAKIKSLMQQVDAMQLK